MHRAVDEGAAGLVGVAVPRGRRLPRRGQPRVRRREPFVVVDRVDARHGVEPPAALRRPAGALRQPDEAAAHLDEPDDGRNAGSRGGRRRSEPRGREVRAAGRQPGVLRHGGLPREQQLVHEGRAGVRHGLGGRVASAGLRPGRVRQRRLDDPRRVVARPRIARRDLDRELERRRRRVRRPLRQRHALGEPPARPSVQGRPQRDMGRSDDQHRQQLRRRRCRLAGRAAAARAAAARRLGRLRRRQGNRDVDKRFVPLDGSRDADGLGATVPDGVRRAARGHRLAELDADHALRRAGQPAPRGSRERPRAVLLDRRDDVEAAAEGGRGPRRRLHDPRRRHGRDRHARARLLRPARRHGAAGSPGRRQREVREGRAAPDVAGLDRQRRPGRPLRHPARRDAVSARPG